MSTTQNSREIQASPEKLYQAFTSPQALEVWMAPGDMTGKVQAQQKDRGSRLTRRTMKKAQSLRLRSWRSTWRGNKPAKNSTTFVSKPDSFAGRLPVKIYK
jgi:uncharacterized protein YndB with AHSA1/START domain